MELNKCKRCGAFFASTNHICPNCEARDQKDLATLKGFLADNDCPATLEALSYDTGISLSNLNRFLTDGQISSIVKNFKEETSGHISIEL